MSSFRSNRSLSKWIFRGAQWAGPPVLLFIVIVGLWFAATHLREIPRYLLPKPEQVVAVAWTQKAMLAGALWLTAQEALCGFGLSLIIGVVIAFAFTQSIFIRRSCYPYAIFLQTVPIVAIAPLIITWFGNGFQSILLVSIILSLFPIITNTTTGLISVDSNLVNLFRLYNAGRWQILLKLRFPHALPYLITGAKISSGLSVIGAIVGEFLVGYSQTEIGLGYLILQSSAQLKTAQLFAAVIASAVLGIAIFGTVNTLGNHLIANWTDTPDDSLKR
ncbi:MAG: ABC transporter permease [Planctomycetota bacterium]|nr:ABC transporter permease [Planctomycetota bacterium]